MDTKTMLLDYFNRCGKYIEFDMETHSCRSRDSVVDTTRICGIGDVVNEEACVALVFGGVGAKLFVGNECFDLNDSTLKVKYENLPGGLSRFSVECALGSAELIYPSWWTTRSLHLVAFADDNDDEDEDFCAYIVYLLSSEKLIKATIDQYSAAH